MEDLEMIQDHADESQGVPNLEMPASYMYQDDLWKSDYDFLFDTYNGCGGYKRGAYLVKHPREVFFKERQTIGFFRNFFKPIANAKVDPIFSQKINRQSDSEMFDLFVNDCTNSKTPLHTFMRDVNREASVQDLTFIVMDNFQDLSNLEAENIKNRKIPYVYEKTADQVIDWEVDQFGNILSIVFIDKKVKDKGTEKQLYRRWDSQESQLLEMSGDSWVAYEQPIVHGLGIIPVYALRYQKYSAKKGFIPQSQMYDLAKMNWTLFNVDSELRYTQRKQALSILKITGIEGNTDDIKVSTDNALCLPPGGDADYIEPDPNIPKEVREYINSLKENLFAIAEQIGVTGVKNADSGIAKEWDFRAHENILKTNAEISKIAELWIADVFKKYTDTTFDYDPTYRFDYSPIATQSRIDVLEQYILQPNIPVSGKKMALQEMTKAVFSDNDPLKVKEVVEDIEKESDDAFQEDNEVNTDVELG